MKTVVYILFDNGERYFPAIIWQPYQYMRPNNFICTSFLCCVSNFWHSLKYLLNIENKIQDQRQRTLTFHREGGGGQIGFFNHTGTNFIPSPSKHPPCPCFLVLLLGWFFSSACLIYHNYPSLFIISLFTENSRANIYWGKR